MFPDFVAELPRVIHAARGPDVPVAAEHDQRFEAFLHRPVCIGRAIFHRVLACQKRDDRVTGDVGPEIADEMAQVVFLFEPDRAVCEEYRCPAPGEAAHRMIRVNPRVHACGGLQLRARRPQFRRNDRRLASETLEK
jgi:hypothetical protein